MSYANVLLYNAATPGYDDLKEGDKPINADDPKNRELYRQILFDE